MPLTAQTLALMEAARQLGVKPVHTLTPAEARVQMRMMLGARKQAPTPVARIEDRQIAAPGRDIQVRLYWPDRRGVLPAILYFHGGGHVIGGIDTHDEVTRVYCAGAEALVVSVDYRKGPEHRFPAAVEDVFAAMAWLHAEATALGIDPRRIALAGDSAGGNLAAVGALHARDNAERLAQPALQVLIYPITDYAMTSESYKTYAEGYGQLTAKSMAWFRDHYLRTQVDQQDWRASPLKARMLAGVAPALVISAECDVLHDEGVAYARALAAAGVLVTHKTYMGVLHGFFAQAPMIDEAVQAQQAAVEALRTAFAI